MDHGLHGEEPAAGGVSIERERACRMIDVLRRERFRLVPARSRLSTQNFARHQARRATGGAASQIRAGRQPQDRQGARARNSAHVARARRRGDRMNRRELIALFGSAAAVAWPKAMWAEQPQRLPTIGFLGLQPASAFASRIEALRKGLHDLGYVEGKNLLIDFQWADTVDQLPGLASLLVGIRVNLIFAPASTYVEPARQATKTIPIVFANHADPVGLGHVESLAHPGGNITGLSMVFTEIAA